MFRLVKAGDLWYYTIDSFTKTGLVHHCFTTRRGGISQNEYESMNLRLNCSDSKENIYKNYEIISQCIGVDVNSLVLSKQVHKVDIADVGKADCGNGLFFENKFDSADAIVTAERGVTLVTFYADCVPVYLLDKTQGVIALVHSGWKGTVGHISRLTVEHMISRYHSRPSDIIAAIGPSIRACHFEVGEEVSDAFCREFSREYINNDYEKPHIDLQGCIMSDLTKAGVEQKNITDSGICTYCNPDLFYSHRRTGNARGTMAAFLQLV